jgi:hypothetical protein
MSESAPQPRRQSARNRPRRNPWLRRLALVAAALLVFGVGIALGQALNDGPPPPSTATYVRTLQPPP